jgi:hypothetical protein
MLTSLSVACRSARGQTLAQMALAWTLRDTRVTSALIGASSVEQLETNIAALDRLGFTADELAEIVASSSGADAPRGIDFLMSRNRLNVAVSRAQCLAYLACAPALLDVDCKTVDHMRLANALCRFVELAETR